MLPSLAILLPFAAFLPLGLTVPSPRGGGGLALAGLAGALTAEGINTIDTSDPPDSGFGASSTCTYSSGSATNADATNPAWTSSMTGCLNALNATNWNGNECAPPVGGVKFGFWKGENDYDDPVDCYGRCAGCLSKAISAGQAVTTKCQYEYSTHRAVLGTKTHTCTMGYDAGG